MQKINNNYIKLVVQKALAEDLSPRGDLTTKLIDSKNKIVTAKIIAKQNGVISGLDFCKAAFKLIGTETLFKKKVKDGEKIKKNKVIAEIKAKIKTILIAERTALNFLNHSSGISTLTNKYVNKVAYAAPKYPYLGIKTKFNKRFNIAEVIAIFIIRTVFLFW